MTINLYAKVGGHFLRLIKNVYYIHFNCNLFHNLWANSRCKYIFFSPKELTIHWLFLNIHVKINTDIAKHYPWTKGKEGKITGGIWMLIFSVIAFFALIVAIVSTFFAIKGRYHLYWVSAIGIYVFSFLAGFSIGQMTVGLTFIPLTLAIGYSFGWIKNKKQSSLFLCLGILIGFLMVIYVGNLLFYPLFTLFN